MANKRIKQSDTNIWGFNPREMGLDMQKQYLKKIVQRANKRMQRLEKSNLYSYAYQRAERDLSFLNRTRFSYRQKTPEDIINEIYRVEAFLAHESSLVQNVRKLQTRAFETLAVRINSTNGIDIRGLNLNRNDFYRFLNSQQFKDMSGRYGSDWVIEDMARALDTDPQSTIKDVIKEYNDFMKEDLPLEAVDMKRRGAISGYQEYREKSAAREPVKYRDR